MKRVAAALLLFPATIMVIACSRPPEQQFLTQFFRAARGRDNTTVGRMSAVNIDPRSQGSVEDFEIVSISEEQRTPLTFKPLFEAEQKARDEESAFLKTKIEYQNANIKQIEEVLKLEQQPNARFSPALQKVKAAGKKGITFSAIFQRRMSARRSPSNANSTARSLRTRSIISCCVPSVTRGIPTRSRIRFSAASTPASIWFSSILASAYIRSTSANRIRIWLIPLLDGFGWSCGSTYFSQTKPVCVLLKLLKTSRSAVGLVVGVVRSGTAPLFCAHGVTDLATRRPVGEDTVFRIGSITKTFTGTLFADMLLTGEVTANQRIGTLFPGDDSLTNGVENATLEQLATHSSGLPRLALDLPTLSRLLSPDPYGG